MTLRRFRLFSSVIDFNLEIQLIELVIISKLTNHGL